MNELGVKLEKLKNDIFELFKELLNLKETNQINEQITNSNELNDYEKKHQILIENIKNLNTTIAEEISKSELMLSELIKSIDSDLALTKSRQK
jgi:hypothetical protein